MLDGADQKSELELPPLASARKILLGLKRGFVPSARMTVIESAEEHMRVSVGGQWQKFSRDVTPYMVEPTNLITSRIYNSIFFCGPSQSGKTQALQCGLSHAITSDHGKVLLVQMSKAKANEYVEERIEPMIRNSPELKERQLKSRSDDNRGKKNFLGDVTLRFEPPTANVLSSSTYRWVLATDYDHFKKKIGGESDPHTMMRARTTVARSRGMVFCESSPVAPIADIEWKPKHPHEAPPVTHGILMLYNTGTMARWYWTCLHCEVEFEPHFDLLDYDTALPGWQADISMICPGCGCAIDHDEKYDLNLGGRWLHAGPDGSTIPLEDLEPSDAASYWLNGTAAAFTTWADLVMKYEAAMDHFELMRDDGPLQGVLNTSLAQPHKPTMATEEEALTIDALKAKADPTLSQGMAPEWAKFITTAVDVQATYFDVMVMAHGAHGECSVVDRFDLITPPDGAPRAGERKLSPAQYIEDWEVLRPLLSKVWPLQDQSYGLKTIGVCYDMQGKAGTTSKAIEFYRKRRSEGEGRQWRMLRGRGKRQERLVWFQAAESRNKGKAVQQDFKILNMASNRLKDIVVASLQRADPGPGFYHIPAWLPDDKLAEYTAEQKTDAGWEARKGMPRNESLDLSYYNIGLSLHFKADKIDWANPPDWCLGGISNPFAESLSGKSAPDPSTKPERKPKAKPKTIGYLNR